MIYREGCRGGSKAPAPPGMAAVRRPAGVPDGGVVDFRRRLAVVGTVRAMIVVEAEVGAKTAFGLHQVGVGLEVNLLVFDRAPESLDENIVQASPFAIHRDSHAMRL